MTQIALSGGTVLAVLLMVVIVLGYVVIWAIWHFVFRGAGDDRPGERPATVAQEPHDSSLREPRSSADSPPAGS